MKKFILLVLVGFVGFTQVKAQKVNELWSAAELDLRLTKSFSVGIDQQFRFVDTTGLKGAISQLSFKQRLSKQWDIVAHYRFVNSPIKPNANRLMLSLAYKDRILKSDFRFSYRLRYQVEKDREELRPDHDFRNKLGLEYNLSKLVDPSLEYEIFLKADKSPDFSKNRITFALEWNLLSIIDIETFYRFQKDIGDSNPDIQHIYGFGIAYGLDLRKD